MVDQWALVLAVADASVRREAESPSAFASFVLDGEVVNLGLRAAANNGLVHKPVVWPTAVDRAGP